MFKGEKTSLFWAGLVILSLAAVILFASSWSARTYSSLTAQNLYSYIQNIIPTVVGAIVFILIGLYMMKSGVKKSNPQTQE